MKHKSKPTSLPIPDKSPERLRRLEALNDRVRGSFKNFMTQDDLKQMREDAKWEAMK